ncbi:ABC transporter ATP-binding protein [Cupriavidus numazuensis]|uniref:High-affinity branched-chain amino acid transport ATP-binding protein LivF n=1 Tax=Cupriavidus numazuensis TaxID=221992 RepID=A0ABN7Q3W9_9BURK|nr:ABC transporter ATP-binding protein [Cupriavidus numazuensis]CAG2153132.1 High-affinity branched-chain amino acid transport ATP-binding protein LivF [Cupriavidus numazuensis]
MLHCENLSAYYKDVAALRNINLTVNRGEAVALIGVNGAGKTTLLKSISGVLNISGTVRYDGEDISRQSVEQRVRGGIAHVPEGRKVFAGLTVKENLLVGAHMRRRDGLVKADLERVYSLFPRLAERSSQLGWSLSGGEQQMLAIGRGLMARPKVLLLDEPSLGLAPRLAEEVYARIADIHEEGLTVLLVEQNTVLALSVASRGYVLESGSVVLEGAAEQLRSDDRVREAYLGHSTH